MFKFICGLALGFLGGLIYEGWKTLGNFESAPEGQ